MMTDEERAQKQAHLNQAAVHLVDAIANLEVAIAQEKVRIAGQAMDNEGMRGVLIAPLKGVLAEVTAEILYMQREGGRG